MQTIILETVHHKNEFRIAVKFDRNASLIENLRIKYKEIRWSNTMKCWHLPNNHSYVSEIYQLFKGTYFVDYSKVKKQDSTIEPKKIINENEKQVSSEKRQALEDFARYLKSRRYSDNTIKVYTQALHTFFLHFDSKVVEEISNEDVVNFNNDYILKNDLSGSYQNQVVNALKLFSKTIQGSNLDPEIIHRPKREKMLPNVLSKEEVKKILHASNNQKHRMMLSLIYACGLRRSELLNLKKTDILSDRMLIHIHQSKGKKDRIVPLSPLILEGLRAYYKTFRPQQWLFEGQKAGQQYSEKSLQNVLKQSLYKASIKKPVTLHWLRHSYATHLLENGTDLRYIQELLGHSSSRTTEIYTHVSTKSIQNIVSPFDTL